MLATSTDPSLANLPFFTTQALGTLTDASADVAKTTASRWVKQGRLIRLKRGVYMPREFMLRYSHRPEFTNLVAGIIKPDSYLSLSYVLQDHGVLTEATYPITSVTWKNTSCYENELGFFEYRNLKKELCIGYETHSLAGIACYRATKAKALFDYLYLRPASKALHIRGFNLAEELRLNIEDFSTAETAEFADYVQFCGSPKMKTIYNNLRENVWQ